MRVDQRAINADRKVKEKFNWSLVSMVFFMTWFLVAVPATIATMIILNYGNENMKAYIPYQDTSEKLKYSGMGACIFAAWFVLWSLGYCLFRKIKEDEVEQVGAKTFLAAGILTGGVAACWWGWKGQALTNPIPDLPKIVFWVAAMSGLIALTILVVSGLLALVCCPNRFRQDFYVRERPEGLGAAFLPNLARRGLEDENEEPEGSPRKKASSLPPVRNYYQSGNVASH